MKYLLTIFISVIISVIIVNFLPYLSPPSLVAVAPSALWWTALAIIATISLGVIGISVAVLSRENESKKEIASLKENLEKYSTENKKANNDFLNFISNTFEIQNVSETKNHDNWKSIDKYINSYSDSVFLNAQTLRAWSTVAWKHGYKTLALKLRETAYESNTKDFLSRVMLCSILTQDKKPDNARIENILNNTDLNSDNITNEDRDHFYNIRGAWYKKNGKFKEASESFEKAIEVNIQTWAINEYILTLIMQEEITNTFIKSEIDRIKRIPNSKWLDDTVLYQRAFRLFANGFINKSKIDVFYNYLTPLMISELVSKYNNEYFKLMFFNFYSQITKKYNDKELNILYLTFYKLLGVYDDQADIELQKQEIIDEINNKIGSR